MFHDRSFRSSYLLLVSLPLTACSKPAVTGTVVDAFHHPLPGATVTVEGTSFSTVTDSRGKYAVQFVPGQFKVVVKRDGYTTLTSSYNVAQSTSLPASDIMLYPRPTESGIFYIGKEKLVPLATSRLRIEEIRNPMPFLPGSTRYLLQKGSAAVLPEGDALFIDTVSRPMELAKATNRSGLIIDTAHTDAAGLVKATAEKVGVEQLTVWKLHLQPGVYGWIEFQENVLLGTVPSEHYYGFQVGDAPWFTFVGVFSSEGHFDPSATQQEMGYRLELYRDPAVGLVGLLDYPVLEADEPTGRIEEVKLDPASGSLTFRARLRSQGNQSNEMHEFTGKLSPDRIQGTFKRHGNDGTLLQTQQVDLKKEPIPSSFEMPYEDLSAWERAIEPILRFRGPR